MTTTGQNEEFLRRLAINDESTLRGLLGDSVVDSDCVDLEAQPRALVRLAAVVAMDSHPTTYQWSVAAALAAGASEDAIVDVLIAVAPVVGSARVTVAAPALAAALGYAMGERTPW
jgi:alkylhydroperoxidase/carboxymuconolactone decarboxylase family protein YurZ